jgi:hypothetical protein
MDSPSRYQVTVRSRASVLEPVQAIGVLPKQRQDGEQFGAATTQRLRYNRGEKWEIETKLLAVVVNFACVGFLG